ncbi:MAG: bifunctional nuclease family protein [Aphanocapsa lilacina HA4352-LM1]|jgi:bifunctional DNase/RNase|uniref:Gll1862 protein n=2 Tax=Gloeobacter TaxID=33071 RepID=Q7NJH0_GLOVI|nr:bifunctional nuclease family protein [Aphanocapsa lilacina HA4352-LM1]UFP94862.1 bifunctional nuclease family protein [Gloeobacter morelensis MG652769]BAC89803.1 gll1862 [Gloeobacter violaceus PCC 7421]
MAVEMKVAAIALDAASRLPIVILRDLHDRRALPIWIGKAEANAILQALEGQRPPRPMTHDLLADLCKEWDLHVEKIVIHSLQNNTFYAIITVRRGKQRKEIDSRPSDAIALALRTMTPIWAMEEVIAEASIPVDQEADEAEREAFRDFLQTLNPNDFIRG